MQHESALESIAGESSAIPRSAAPTRVAFVALALGALWFVCCRHLSEEWRFNEQYSYGWFVPFFAAYLFWLRWEDRPEKSRISDFAFWIVVTLVALVVIILPAVRLFEIANPDWRLLGWLHAGAVVAITLAIIYCAGGRTWLRHFAFPTAFIFVAVPWISAIETPIVQGLMRVVASGAAETVSLFGVPAQVQGNIIRLSTGTVGVNEACSGVRSLQTSIMIGLLFGELKRLTVSRRVALVVMAIAIALFANFLRALFLVLIAARENLAAVGRWHDFAGYAIVALVFLGTMLIARQFGGTGSVPSKKKVDDTEVVPLSAKSLPAAGNPQFYFLPCNSYFLLFLLWLIATELGVEAWYRARERSLVEQPRWTVRWPESAPGFRELRIDERSRRLLRFDEGRGATWVEPSPPAASERPKQSAALLYFFRWHPGQNNALLASAHRPDVCLPATGWQQIADRGVRWYRVNDGLSLPFRHFEFTHPSNLSGPPQEAHAFYCLWEDRIASDEKDELAGAASEWTWAERFRVVADGRRHRGQQVMEFVLTSGSPESAENDFARVLPELIVPASGQQRDDLRVVR